MFKPQKTYKFDKFIEIFRRYDEVDEDTGYIGWKRYGISFNLSNFTLRFGFTNQIINGGFDFEIQFFNFEEARKNNEIMNKKQKEWEDSLPPGVLDEMNTLRIKQQELLKKIL
jgi:hypothetical protein